MTDTSSPTTPPERPVPPQKLAQAEGHDILPGALKRRVAEPIATARHALHGAPAGQGGAPDGQ